jgi:hypothetical protein
MRPGLNQVLSRFHSRQPSCSVVPSGSPQKPEESLLEGFAGPRSITAFAILRRKSVTLEDGYAGQKACATSRAARELTEVARSRFRCSRPNTRQALWPAKKADSILTKPLRPLDATGLRSPRVARDVCVLRHLIYGCHNDVIASANERGKRQFSPLYRVLRQANAALHHYRVDGGMIPAISVRIGNHPLLNHCLDRHQMLVDQLSVAARSSASRLLGAA